jgi:hypothetical protein
MEPQGIDPADPSVTRALLVAGWAAEEVRIEPSALEALRSELRRISIGARVEVQGSLDADATDPAWATFVVGGVGPIDRANEAEPTGPLSLRDLRALVEAAEVLPDAIRETAVERLTRDAEGFAPSVFERPPALYLVPAGPFAHGYLAYGVRIERSEAAKLELPAHFGHTQGMVSAEGEEILPPQTPHPIGVAGVQVAAGGSVMEALSPVDVSDDAHRERAATIDPWPGKPGYYLTASYVG